MENVRVYLPRQHFRSLISRPGCLLSKQQVTPPQAKKALEKILACASQEKGTVNGRWVPDPKVDTEYNFNDKKLGQGFCITDNKACSDCL
jgi:hypothetical protein